MKLKAQGKKAVEVLMESSITPRRTVISYRLGVRKPCRGLFDNRKGVTSYAKSHVFLSCSVYVDSHCRCGDGPGKIEQMGDRWRGPSLGGVGEF